MRRRVKILAISAAVVAVALFVLVSAWGWLTPLTNHFNGGMVPSVAKSYGLAATLPNFTIISKYLHNEQYLSYLKDIALIVLLLLLLVWRAFLLIKSRQD